MWMVKAALFFPPKSARRGVHLGTWVLTSSLAAGPNLGGASPKTGIHNVYTQAESLKLYKPNRKWPDGAVMVMEVREIKWDDLPTGHVIGEGEPAEWFVMIKDTRGRFPGNSHWGDEWGWALFRRSDPKINSSGNYKTDCLSCHEPEKGTDHVFEWTYPTLK
jgi:cytochrome c